MRVADLAHAVHRTCHPDPRDHRLGGSARLGEIAANARLGQTTVHNILTTLIRLRYVRHTSGDRRYHLGGRILNLSRLVDNDEALRGRLRPVLEKLAAATGRKLYLAVPCGDDVLYLDSIDPGRPRQVSKAARHAAAPNTPTYA